MRNFICFFIIIALLTGCSSKTVTNMQAEITVSILDKKLIPNEEGTYSNNRWTKWVNENSPVKVSWVPISQNNFEQALNIMFASNTAPDLIVNTNRALMQNLADKNLIQPVDNYIFEYSTQYLEYLKAHEYLHLYTTLKDKTYLFTSETETIADSGIWIRKDWLDALGLSVPENTTDLLNAARAFTFNDPDRNGLNDSLGIAFMTDMFEQLFMVDQRWYKDDHGQIYIAQLSDRFLDMLLYKRQMFEEGIIDKNFIVDINSQKQMQIWLKGKCGILFSDWNADEFRSLLKNEPSAVIIPMEPVSTVYGKNGTRHKSPVGQYVAFNSNMASPESGIKFLDWMISQGYQTLLYGINGQHYNNKYGFMTPIDVDKNNIELKYATYDMPILRKGSISPALILKSAPEDSTLDQTIAKLNADSLSISLGNTHRQDIPVSISANVTKIKQFETEWDISAKNIETDFILSSLTDSPISKESLKEAFTSKWRKLDGPNIQHLMQQWYDENKDRFYYGLEFPVSSTNLTSAE